MMDGGIFLGKCSPSSMSKVPTFVSKFSTREYYYCSSKWGFDMKKASGDDKGSGMKYATPVILAFWSE